MTIEAIFIGQGKIEPYSAEQHLWQAKKFLFWEAASSPTGSDLLVVGDQEKHAELRHATFAHYYLTNGVQQLSRPTGAGDLGVRIMSWRSVHYDLTTPDFLRASISMALGST